MTPSAIDGFTPDKVLYYNFQNNPSTENQAYTYVNSDDSQIVIAISGTYFGHGNNKYGLKNLFTDLASFPTGVPLSALSTRLLKHHLC
jgi:hypothetical protein